MEALPEWNHDNIEFAIRELAVSGRTVDPSVFELLVALGRERVLRRF